MFISILVYFIFIILIFWAYFGYPFLLFTFYILDRKKNKVEAEKTTPVISVLVPCHNEEKFIEQKLNNIKSLEYPKDKLKVYFLDGNSTDNTLNILMEKTKYLDYIEVIQTGISGKIKQINHVLPNLTSDIVINTDADVMLSKNAIKTIASAFLGDDNVAVVGAFTHPEKCLPIERIYWDNQNLFRMIESKVYASSIVVAPCYGFKRELLKTFPEDCVADDIYISFLANTMGGKTKYIKEAVAHELRATNKIREFIVHKFRKGNAYVTEILRFLHRLPQMCGLWKLIYLTKLVQVVVVPWVIPLFLLASISLMLSGAGPLKIVIFAFAFLGLSFLCTHILVTSGRKKGKARYIPITYLQLFLITNLILIVVGLTYPFYRSSSEYYKIDEG